MVLFRFASFVLVIIFFLITTPPSYAQGYAPLGSLEEVFRTAITSLAVIGGFLAFLALIYSGFKYITARGDPKAIASAQSTIVWALIGFILIIVAWLVLVFISSFTDVDVTNFKLGF